MTSAFSRIASAAGIWACVSGCTFGPQFQRVAFDQNEAVANSTNQVTLLNILRARDRQPLHFTAISKLSGNAKISAGGSANIQIKPDASSIKSGGSLPATETTIAEGIEVLTPQLQAQLENGSSMDVTVYDTQEFYQGILSSVPAATVAHYLRQGWPDDLLTYLFVSEIDAVAKEKYTGPSGITYEKGQTVATLANDPDEGDSSAAFKAFVDCYRLSAYQKTTPDYPLVRLDELKEFSGTELALLDGDKFEIDSPADLSTDPSRPPPPVRWIKRKGRTVDALGLRKVSPKDCQLTMTLVSPIPPATTPTAPTSTRPTPPTAESTLQDKVGAATRMFAALAIESMMDEGAPADEAAAPEPDDHSIVASGTLTIKRDNDTTDAVPIDFVVVLRSTQGIIYFLGEYLRERKGGDPKAPDPAYKVWIDGADRPVIAVTTDRPPTIFATARFQGKTFYVSANTKDSGRSSQVFELVQQLVNLQKSSKERPTTQTVRVIP